MFATRSVTLRGAAELLGREFGEPAFDQVEPGTVGRRAMDDEAQALRQPRPNQWRFVGAGVVHDQMGVQIRRHGRGNPIQELSELNGPMAAMGFGEDRTRLRVERRE